jgi:hypothetical protein
MASGDPIKKHREFLDSAAVKGANCIMSRPDLAGGAYVTIMPTNMTQSFDRNYYGMILTAK